MVDVDGQKGGGGKCQVTIQLYCRLSVASVISQRPRALSQQPWRKLIPVELNAQFTRVYGMQHKFMPRLKTD